MGLWGAHLARSPKTSVMVSPETEQSIEFRRVLSRDEGSSLALPCLVCVASDHGADAVELRYSRWSSDVHQHYAEENTAPRRGWLSL